MQPEEATLQIKLFSFDCTDSFQDALPSAADRSMKMGILLLTHRQLGLGVGKHPGVHISVHIWYFCMTGHPLVLLHCLPKPFPWMFAGKHCC